MAVGTGPHPDTNLRMGGLSPGPRHLILWHGCPDGLRGLLLAEAAFKHRSHLGHVEGADGRARDAGEVRRVRRAWWEAPPRHVCGGPLSSRAVGRLAPWAGDTARLPRLAAPSPGVLRLDHMSASPWPPVSGPAWLLSWMPSIPDAVPQGAFEKCPQCLRPRAPRGRAMKPDTALRGLVVTTGEGPGHAAPPRFAPMSTH